MPRKKLSKYTNKNRFSLIYIIVFSIFWMGLVIWMFYWNSEDETENFREILPFLLFWCFFLGFGIYNVHKRIKRKNLKDRLLLEWNRLIATVVDIESVGIMFKLGEFQMMWRWSWFKIHAKYEDKNFISPKICINVTKYIKVWDKIPVFVDLCNPEDYYMDLDNINSI